jgi:hypothetical protein
VENIGNEHRFTAKQFGLTSKGNRSAISSPFRIPHPLYSQGMNPCNFSSFGPLKEILKDRELKSNDKIGKEIAIMWDSLISDFVQSAFQNWMTISPGSLRMDESSRMNQIRFACPSLVNVGIGRGDWTLFTSSILAQFRIRWIFFEQACDQQADTRSH